MLLPLKDLGSNLRHSGIFVFSSKMFDDDQNRDEMSEKRQIKPRIPELEAAYDLTRDNLTNLIAEDPSEQDSYEHLKKFGKSLKDANKAFTKISRKLSTRLQDTRSITEATIIRQARIDIQRDCAEF